MGAHSTAELKLSERLGADGGAQPGAMKLRASSARSQCAGSQLMR